MDQGIGAEPTGTTALGREPDLEAVLDALRAERGLDFHLYRRTTIERRLSQRMAAVHAPDCGAYLDVLSRQPAEFDHLIGHLTLKVTGFFRNPPVFDLLRRGVLPDLLAECDELTAWSAGCATGEEPYSVAILLEDLLAGRERRPLVRIVATDIDERALAAAAEARYSAAFLGDLPLEILSRRFTLESDNRRTSYLLREESKRHVCFSWHNLASEPAPPPGAGANGFDLVLCRNVLIYFQRPLQEQVLATLHAALRSGGYLVLGEAESLTQQMEAHYACVDRRARIYKKRE